jgi:hypothetical protein
LEGTKLRAFLAIFVILTVSPGLGSEELAYTRRMLSLTPQFLEKAETKVVPAQTSETKGTVLVVFWTSERGTVVSIRALDGPIELRKAATEAIYKWKFKPTSLGGQPVQMGSAVLIDGGQNEHRRMSQSDCPDVAASGSTIHLRGT